MKLLVWWVTWFAAFIGVIFFVSDITSSLFDADAENQTRALAELIVYVGLFVIMLIGMATENILRDLDRIKKASERITKAGMNSCDHCCGGDKTV